MSVTVTAVSAFGADLDTDPDTWPWTNVTTDSLGSITVTRGRPDGSGQTRPTQVTDLKMKNPAGKWTPKHPMSPNWPYVDEDLPIRATVGGVQRALVYADDFDVTSVTPDYAETEIGATGLLRLLGQGSRRLDSPMRRGITADGPLALWSMEDGGGDSYAEASGGQPMRIGGVAPGSTTGPAGVSGMARLDAGTQLYAPVPASPSATEWSVELVLTVPTFTPTLAATPAVRWITGGTLAEWRVTLYPGAAQIGVEAWSTTGARVIDKRLAWDLNGAAPYDVPVLVTVFARQDGADIEYEINYGNADGTTRGVGDIYLAATISGAPTSVQVPAWSDHGGWALGQISVWDRAIDPHLSLLGGYTGELAVDRLIRLCLEENVPLIATAGRGPAMGPQTAGGLLVLLRECEDVDGGILTDGTGPGLTYLDRASRYNIASAMTLDCNSRQVKVGLHAVRNDEQVRNDWTITSDVGSARVVRPARVSRPDSATLNLALSGDHRHQAGWRVRLGQVDELRLLSVTVDLIDSPELQAAWLALDIGARITLTHLPRQFPPGVVDAVLEHYIEEIDGVTWKLTLTLSPYAPWNVAVVGETWRIQTDGSTLAVGVNATATSWLAASVGKLWLTTAARPADFPLYLDVGGEQVRLDACSGGSSPQPMTVVRSVNGVVKPQLAGTPITEWRPAALAL